MAKFSCCSGINSVLIGRKKNEKVDKEPAKTVNFNKAIKTLKIKLEEPVKPLKSDELKTISFRVSVPFDVQKSSCDIKVMSQETPAEDESVEVAYEGEDEHEENGSMKRDLSDFDLQARLTSSGEQQLTLRREDLCYSGSFGTKVNDEFTRKVEKCNEKDIDMIQSGHVSDPGTGKAEFWGSPKLKRSCSNLETSKLLRKEADCLPPPRSQYTGELEELPEKLSVPGSPVSHRSADRVMLKKHSSSQVLPSRSRRLWWKLFLWSHRNLHKPRPMKPQPDAVSTAVNQKAGYTSDTLEPNRATTSGKMQSPGSFTGESFNIGHNNNGDDNHSWNGFHGGVSELWPQNQWVAFSTGASPFARVDKWVKELETQPPPADAYDDDNDDGSIVFPPSPDRSPATSTAHLTPRRADNNLTEEILHANNLIQSLNSSATVAHISGIGLKALPTISSFSSLRSVNLSNNLIANITPGSLPKGLHTLNLSRNKISTIEGLRSLTRLRILDLSYNRISRIGQGLSNCTIIKELYLAGNKISDVEGLHRLLKLVVLDLSFNKITTTKALGQLVANYNSLQALNLLGNPIQSNVSDDQLRKSICGLLPKLTYLNKQPIKPQRAREVLTDSVAKAALGTSSSWNSRRKAANRVSSGASSSSIFRSSVSVKEKGRSSRSKSRTHRSKTKSSARASTSR